MNEWDVCPQCESQEEGGGGGHVDGENISPPRRSPIPVVVKARPDEGGVAVKRHRLAEEVAQKIGAPNNPELAIGAIAGGGSAWLNEKVIE